ncbi:hypothetical protein JJB11_16810 [Ramlibacter ginsenosidimutans]|uniref:DUF2946 domain-containing protein n=1 Tax=Ramlibacter ginsenosidimutans TaxID=502333 RepID=A0A934TW21_9BURK|nr:hypothetical protein [Ramlibacter ginsenosidimutans]MBK6007762.1 hypothetical protein [Ramlibacter ginsenosidimutans]
MNLPRTSRRAAALALAWFVLFLGVAGLSPVLHASPLDPICSVAAAGQDLGHRGNDGAPGSTHTLKCALCIGVLAPPANSATALARSAPLAGAPTLRGADRVAVRASAPLPARGPPTLA